MRQPHGVLSLKVRDAAKVPYIGVCVYTDRVIR